MQLNHRGMSLEDSECGSFQFPAANTNAWVEGVPFPFSSLGGFVVTVGKRLMTRRLARRSAGSIKRWLERQV
jgi:hypothetical protein